MLDQFLSAERSSGRARSLEGLNGAGSWGSVLSADDAGVVVLVNGIDYGPVTLVPAALEPNQGDAVFLVLDSSGQPAYAIDPAAVAGLTFPEAERLIGQAGEPAFANGWSNLGSGFAGAQFYKDPFSVVHVEGVITGGTIGSVPAFTLPTGYRPSASIVRVVSSNGADGAVVVNSSGDVLPTNGSNAIFGLGFSFRV